ncbi:MAG TPA: tetratricopeptide repeat protein [Dongiaceae bacterium]|nr:tetratricopeptide repeat protein [Dongiaceae bacterium]
MTCWLVRGAGTCRPVGRVPAVSATALSRDGSRRRYRCAGGLKRRWHSWLGIALGALLLANLMPIASADQTDHRLPALFDQLRQAKTPGEAATIEGVIWAIWTESGDKELDRLMMEGSTAMAMRDYATALSDFDEITNRAPQFAEGWNKRATLLYLLGDLQASLDDIARVLKLEPRHFGALAGLGLVNLGLDHEEAARDAFRDVLKIDPMNAAAKANLKAVQQEIDNKSI